MGEVNDKLRTPENDYLVEALKSIKSTEEGYKFLEDICTVNEIRAMAQRLQVARMLKEKHTYLDIASTTGASTATISRVNRSLNYGTDGYSRVLKKIVWKNNDEGR